MREPLHINLYSDITSEVAQQVANALLANPGADVILHINSPGGNVTDGYALANAIRSHEGHKTAIVDGLCASAATFPACACDEVFMHPESLFMVHGPWGEVSGTPEDMATQSDLLGKMADLCLAMYQRKTGASEKQIRKWMSSDTWMKPGDALAAGFCDKILTVDAPPQTRAAVRRYMAKVRKGKAAMSYELPEHLNKKLAKHGLGDEMTPEMLRAAFRSYMEDSEDKPEERREMSRAMAEIEKKIEGDQDEGERKDNPVTTQRASAESEESDTDAAKSKGRMRADADMDPAVAKLVSSLTDRVAKMSKQVEGYETKERARELAEFHAFAKSRVSQKDADEYLSLAGGDIAKARAIVAKHPERTAMQRMTQGGKPIGAAQAHETESEAAPMASDGRHQLHGFALSKNARAQMGKDLPKTKNASFHALAAAQRTVAKTRPDLYA
jgi:ATP-dependent protease ClpP protease subunit